MTNLCPQSINDLCPLLSPSSVLFSLFCRLKGPTYFTPPPAEAAQHPFWEEGGLAPNHTPYSKQ